MAVRSMSRPSDILARDTEVHLIGMMDVLRRPSSFKPHSCEGNLPQRLKLDMMISIIARGGAKRSRHDIIQTELQLHLNTSPPFEYWNNAEVELGI
jgi:hypothetical protein